MSERLAYQQTVTGIIRRALGDEFIKKSRGRPVRLVVRACVQSVMGTVHFVASRMPLLSTYRSYRPDSDYVFGLHPEFEALRDKWVSGNRRNNAGDLGRLYFLILNAKQIEEERVAGDFAEVGVFRGNSAAVLAHFAGRYDRRVFLFDTFEGFDRKDLSGIDESHLMKFAETSLEDVKRRVGDEPFVSYIVGRFPESVTPEVAERAFALVHIDCDLYEPIKQSLEFFYPRLSEGGMLIVHDYGSGAWAGAKEAVDEFCAKIAERPALLSDKSGTAVLRKSHSAVTL